MQIVIMVNVSEKKIQIRYAGANHIINGTPLIGALRSPTWKTYQNTSIVANGCTKAQTAPKYDEAKRALKSFFANAKIIFLSLNVSLINKSKLLI
jgi:hypothetical protein